MSRRRRIPKGQRSLIDPETQALYEFERGMGESTLNMEIICPFCAFKGKVREFGTKKSAKSESYSTKMFVCPDCYQRMRRATLLRDMTVSEWARWLYFDVIMSHGYNRISFPQLLKRLKEYGWAREFWSAWRAAKESRETSDVEDYLDYVKQSKAMSAQDIKDMCDKYKQGLAGKNSMTCTTCEWHKRCWAEVK